MKIQRWRLGIFRACTIEGEVNTVTGRIELNPEVMLGKPVIRGTRVPVELLLRKLAEGATMAGLLDAYPRLHADDDAIAHETVVALH